MFKHFEPHDLLKDHVLFLGEIHITSPKDMLSFGGLCIPTGCSYLGFQSKGRLIIKIGDRGIKTNQTYAGRQATIPYQIDSDDDEVIATVAICRPTGFYHLFGLQNDELVNCGGDAIELFDDSVLQNKRPLPKRGTTEERINWLNDLLISQLKRREIKLNVIDKAVTIINQERGLLSITDLVQKCGISDRYFQKQFKRIVGLTPSTYRNIIRFLNILSEIEAREYKDLTSAFSFYDYAHFSKAFKQFSGENYSAFDPKEFDFLYHATIENKMWLDKD